ncbi:MAG TPA: DNA polymerase III subunit delta [Chthoniobacteraceae bacterium]|jgi:DNA polymerase-3 subunit delta
MAAATKRAPAALAQIHAVLGSDESEVKRAAKELAAQLQPASEGDFGADVIDGLAENSDQAATKIHQTIEALLTFPFFGGEKLVWLKNANFLGDSVTGRAAATVEALEKLTELLKQGLPQSIRFLLSATEVDKRRTFFKTLQKVANVEVFDRLDASKSGWEEEASFLVQRLAEEHNLRFTSDALELFTLSTGGDRRIIAGELEKLDLYLGSERREATDEDVRKLVPLSRAGIIFELGNALAERNLSRALELLDQLLFQGESAIGIQLVAVIPTVRNLLVVKDLMTRHKLQRPQQPFFFGKILERLPPAATAHLPRKKDGTVNAYSLGIAAVHAHRYTIAELQPALEACLQANVQLVTSALEPQIVIGQLLVKIITAPAAAGAR